MTAGRPFTRADYLAIKSATRRACEDAGPLHQIAESTRVDAPILSRYGNPDESVFIPLDVAMDLDALSGGDRLLRAWATLRGYDLTRDDKGVAIECPMQDAAALLKEAGEAVSALADVVKRPTPRTAAQAERELAELGDVVELAEANARRIQARGA